ncbi:BREX-1 system adenine-specific DNA-methyltransferase PglX [Bifidobacterium scaligerum]|uniref:site-specific DNA-methyltransferase (adenine-specific) n=1 Tax=Bifidobacterium scaligerum TaxID=2052656 RepID=A0A2M9HSW9_9BIFI|nr:BREX-1 system adenine-specific DNA-methyltransferase PglX [Bifidobacterium scaligerum]PJM79901.1 class I SAM-dependent DNA methyltransferase [Bifidobacterium scaligerum]
MNTSKLQAFAAEARAELMKMVRAKLDAAMEPDSAARVDNSGAFAKLDEEIRQAGGGEQGRAKTAERHAYRWFNRIIALRYMDANDFTSPHVVSGDDADNPNALPAVLSAVKRGEFDDAVFGSAVGTKTKLVPTITALLDGSRTSNDPQGEAYGLLLRAYCDYWHKFMPFMFDDAGAADEILMPADLLASDSILRKAVEIMTVADCVDDERQGNVEIIGWLYQFYISERKNEVMAGFKKSKKAGAAEIPAATQLFTPDWIVQYLVQNTVGRLWTQSHPESQLWKNWAYYIKQEESAAGETLTINSPEELTVCDPACGSGHMLTYAFDLLYDIYDEAGYSANEIPALILQHNLFGMEIDERAANLAAFALTMKARGRYRRFFRKQVQPNIQRITPEYFTETEVEELNELYGVSFDADTWNTYQHADIYGSLIQPPSDLAALAVQLAPSDRTSPLSKQPSGLFVGDVASDSEQNNSVTGGENTLLAPDLLDRSRTLLAQTRLLATKYATVVANPPYMGSGNMGDELKKYINNHYENGKADLFATFYYRATSLTCERGFSALITGDAWMFIKSFENMRRDLIRDQRLYSLIHLRDSAYHADTFGANSAFVFSKKMEPIFNCGITRFIKTVANSSDMKKNDVLTAINDKNFFTVNQQDFAQIPGSPIVYWLSDAMKRIFAEGKVLSSRAELREGINTGDNDRFIRLWWEEASNSSDLNRHDLHHCHKWIAYKKGGEFRKWYGNQDYILDWDKDGFDLRNFKDSRGNLVPTLRNTQYFFKKSLSWTRISSGDFSIRDYPAGQAFDSTGPSLFSNESDSIPLLGILNSAVCSTLLSSISPTLDYRLTSLGRLPIREVANENYLEVVKQLVSVSQSDWNSCETSWDFAGLEVLKTDNLSLSQPSADSSLFRGSQGLSLAERIPAYIEHCKVIAEEQRQREVKNNELVADAYGVRSEVLCDVPIERVSLKRNPAFAYPKNTPAERDELMTRDIVKEIISYAVGCMFGRYSLDKLGLILASQGETIDDYHAQIPNPTFEPNADNVIPVTDDEWFEDDIVARFRTFLAAACGEQHVNENVAYIEEVLGKPLRKYFASDFYDDHVKMYKSRPIYWMYSSRTDKKGTFKALVYLHRYTPATTNNVLKYLREFTAKLNAQSEHLLASENAAEVRKGEKLRVSIKECTDYERDVLYPLATRNLAIDLDDGVLVNYLRMGKAVRAIKPIEAKRKTVQSWTWPVNPLED